MFVTVNQTATSIGRVRQGVAVANVGSDIVYLGKNPVEVNNAPNSGIPLYPASAVLWPEDGYLWAVCPANTHPQVEIIDGGTIPFTVPFASGEQIIPSGLRSGNYIPATSGWRLAKDGSVEFNALGGTFQVNSSGVFFYIPNAAVGNLRFSVSIADGTDQYGNQYKKGLFSNQLPQWFTGPQSDTVLINTTGAVGPSLQFIRAGQNAMMELVGIAQNLMMFQALNASGAVLNVNMPFVATGGYQGAGSSPASQPPFNVLGSMVLYASGVWAPITLLCPPSETIALNQLVVGFNNASTTSTLSLACQIKQGSTVIMSPNQYGNGAVITPEGSPGGATNMHQKFRQYIVGQDVLGGFSGQTLTITPAWQISSGSAATASIDNTAHIAAYPLPYTVFQSG
jgi:hypothetical protein